MGLKLVNGTVYQTPMTELEAINEMLSLIGEPPINSLEDSDFNEADIARTILRNTSRAVQAEGLHCNTAYNCKLHPDVNNKIQIPDNTLSLDPMDRAQDLIVYRGRLYNRDGFTDIFKEDVYVSIVFMQNFYDLPEHVRQYIAIRAARVFQERVLGSTNISKMTQDDEERARINMWSHEIDNQEANMLNSWPLSNGSIRRGSVW